MTGLTDFITMGNWEDIFTIWFYVIDDAYQALQRKFGPWRKRGPLPSFSDSEVIAIALIIETFFHGHEDLGLAFVRQYHLDLFPKLLPNGQFNERRRTLGLIIEQIRRYLNASWGLIASDDALRIVDSAPIPVCTYMRASRNQTVCGNEYFSVMTTRGAKLFGLRLSITVNSDQVVDQWLLAPAGPHDNKVMGTFFSEMSDLFVLGDGAYHDPGEAQRLLHSRNITLQALPRKDATCPLPKMFRQWASRMRRRVETAFSVLVTVFGIEKLGSRSLSGLIARVATRLLAYNLCFITSFLLSQPV
jgi:hypothetical protein